MNSSKTALILMIVFLLPLPTSGSDEKHFQSGHTFAGEQKLTLPSDASSLPGYKGTNVAESLLDSSSIQTSLNKRSQQKDNVSSFIHETHDQRLRFKIDPATDPVFTESDKIIADPLKVLKAEKTEIKTAPKTIRTKHTCDESGEPYEISCKKILQIDTIRKTKTYLYTRISGKQFKRSGSTYGVTVSQTKGPSNVAHDQWYDYKEYKERPDQHLNYFDGCNYYPHTVTNIYTYSKSFAGEQPKPITEAEYNSPHLTDDDIRESWTSDCEALEQKIDQGLCTYVSRLCLQKNQTRILNGFSITRPCWEEALTYACQPSLHHGCDHLKKKGCVQIHSQCKEYKGKSCITFTQTYQCTTRQDGHTVTTLSGKIPYCLDGQCVDQGFAPNEDMAETLSALSILREIQKDKDMNGPAIFKGEELGCNRNCINFKDCCGSGDGWGVSMGLAGCSEKEKALSQLRQEKKCVYVGTYCAEKAPVIGCLRKKSNYCCFGSKMARLIQEQGRKQLTLSFGAADSPQCRGLTAQELVKIDFSKVDLSELFADVWSKMKPPNLQKLSEDFQESWSDRKSVLEESQKPYRDHLKQENPDAVF